MVTVNPDEHTISCIKGEFLIEIVEVTGGFATFSVITWCQATLKVPNPIFEIIVVSAVHSRHHVILYASEIKGIIIRIHISCPVAIFKRIELVRHFMAAKSKLTIFVIVIMPAVMKLSAA